MTFIAVCCDGPDSREGETREPIIPSRPLLAAQHSRHAGSDFPSLDLGDGSFARVQGRGGCRRTTGHRAPLNSFPTIRGVGSLIPGLRRALKPRKQPRNGFSQGFQDIILSAGSAGLAGVLVGHQQTRRKLGNVRHSTGEIRHEQR